MNKYGYLIMLLLLVSGGWVESKVLLKEQKQSCNPRYQKCSSEEVLVTRQKRSCNNPKSQQCSPEQLGYSLIEHFRSASIELEYVEKLVNLGADVNYVIENSLLGETALMLASQKGHVPSVEFLLRAGADPNIKNSGGVTALAYASISMGVKKEQRFKTMVALLNNGKNCNPRYQKCSSIEVNIRDNDGRTVLTMVKQSDLPKKEKQAVISLLKKHGAKG